MALVILIVLIIAMNIILNSVTAKVLRRYHNHIFYIIQGSMVPFCMRVLKAELLFLLGSDQSLDPLHELLAHCRRYQFTLRSWHTVNTINRMIDQLNKGDASQDALQSTTLKSGFPTQSSVGAYISPDDVFDSTNLDNNDGMCRNIPESDS